jgi:hypothetical protein
LIAVGGGPVQQGEQQWVADRSAWPVVEVTVDRPEELEVMIDELEEIVASERPFALLVSGPADLAAWRHLLWGSPDARRRLRRLRPSLGTWCVGSAHLVGNETRDLPTPAALRPAELAWGCAAGAFADRKQARSWLRDHLADRGAR